MLLAVLIPLASFTTGLQASRQGPAGEQRLWRQPRHLSRDLLAILILVPLWALLLVLDRPAVTGRSRRAADLRPRGRDRAGRGHEAHGPARQPHAHEALDLNLVVLVLSLAFVPIAFVVVASLFHRDFHVGVGAVAKVVLGRALLPLLLGLGAARLFPRAAAAAGPWLMKILNIALLAVVVLALIATGNILVAVGGAGWLVAAAVALGAVMIGHLLGGPDPEERGVVAAASAMRFPALALVLAAAMPGGNQVIPVVLAYVLCAFVATTLYGLIMARRRRHETPIIPIGATPRHA